MPYMKFLSVRSDICRQLPSDSTSRWTPLPLTMQFPLLGLARDFHPLDNAHAERTTKKSVGKQFPTDFFIFKLFQDKKRLYKKKNINFKQHFFKILWLFHKLFVILGWIWYKPFPNILEIERSVMLIL